MFCQMVISKNNYLSVPSEVGIVIVCLVWTEPGNRSGLEAWNSWSDLWNDKELLTLLGYIIYLLLQLKTITRYAAVHKLVTNNLLYCIIWIVRPRLTFEKRVSMTDLLIRNIL